MVHAAGPERPRRRAGVGRGRRHRRRTPARGPPGPSDRGETPATKPEQRGGWLLDLQIAACAWAHGYVVLTENRRDFEVIVALIDDLYPNASSLELGSADQL